MSANIVASVIAIAAGWLAGRCIALDMFAHSRMVWVDAALTLAALTAYVLRALL